MDGSVKKLAKNNKLTNDDMFTVLKKQDIALLSKDLEVYYKSVIGILNHLIITDILWLQRIKENFDNYNFLNNNLLDIKVVSMDQDISNNNIDTIEKNIKTLDNLFIQMIENNIKSSDYESDIKFKSSKGDPMVKNFENVLLHVFNHHTHHRGEISACLNILKIDNDYSGLIGKNL